MLRLFTIVTAAGIFAPAAGVCAEQPCKPSPYQLCLDLPKAQDYQQLDSNRTGAPQTDFGQLQKSDKPPPDAMHDRRMKLDEDTSIGLGGRGIGIKRSF